MGLTQTAAPEAEPLTAAEAKAHLRVVSTDDDTYIGTLIEAARARVENFLARQLISATWALTLDEFAPEIVLPFPPFQSLTSIAYVDANGDDQTLSSSVYTTYLLNDVTRVIEDYNQDWPTTRTQRDAVTVTWVAGYGDAGSDVPASIRHAMLLVIGDLYEHREARLEVKVEDNRAVRDLLWPYRNLRL